MRTYKFNVKVVTPKHHMIVVTADSLDEAKRVAENHLKDNAPKWKRKMSYEPQFVVEPSETGDDPVFEGDEYANDFDEDELQEHRDETQDYVVIE